jgi:hypothetical protein
MPMKNNFYQILKMRLWHVPWLVGTFILSLLAMPFVLWFAGMGQGGLAFIYFASLIISHLIAFGTGFILRVKTWRAIICLCGIALLPPISCELIKLHDAWYLHFQAASDRFRNNLIDPIPKSVSHLEIVPLQEAFVSDLIFRFEIAPDDLDKIIRFKGFRKIGVNEFARKDDLFTYQKYLPLSEPTSFYIHEDDYKNNIDILKVSSDGKKVIFREESSNDYTNGDWGNNSLIKEDEHNFIRQLSRTNNP